MVVVVLVVVVFRVVVLVVVVTVVVVVVVVSGGGWAWPTWGSTRLDNSRAKRKNRYTLIPIILSRTDQAHITLAFNVNRTPSENRLSEDMVFQSGSFG